MAWPGPSNGIWVSLLCSREETWQSKGSHFCDRMHIISPSPDLQKESGMAVSKGVISIDDVILENEMVLCLVVTTKPAFQAGH